MIALTKRRAEEVQERLRREWHGLADPAALASTLAAEHMRSLIYGATVVERDVNRSTSIHTGRLLTSARRAVELLWPHYARQPPVSDIPAVTLGQMQTLTDTARIGAGHWLATPLRIVTIDDASHYLVVGSAPAQVAQRTLATPLTCAGPARFVDRRVLMTKDNSNLAVPLDRWFGHQQPIAAWTTEILSLHETKMEAVEGLSAEHLEIYAPDLLQAQHKNGRWILARQVGQRLEGPRLCRPQERYSKIWDRPLYLAHFHFKNNTLTLRRAASVSRDLGLRLCFGLDITLLTPRRFSVVRDRDVFWIEHPPPLPEPEARIYSLCWKPFEQANSDRVAFHAFCMPYLLRALQRLAILPTIKTQGMA